MPDEPQCGRFTHGSALISSLAVTTFTVPSSRSMALARPRPGRVVPGLIRRGQSAALEHRLMNTYVATHPDRVPVRVS